MRISYFVPRCTPDNSHGRYVVELVKRFGAAHAITVYAGAFWPPLRNLVSCRFVPVPIRPAVIRLAALWTRSIFALKGRSADVVHVQGADAPVGTVVTAHFCNQVMRSSVDHDLPLRRRINYAIGAAAEKYSLSKMTTRKIIAVSETLKGDIVREYGVDPNKVVVIHHGVDADLFRPHGQDRSSARLRHELGLEPDAFVIAFVGGEYRRKGLDSLLAATARVGGAVRILAIGVTPDEHLTRLIRKAGLATYIRFVGHTVDVSPYYRVCDCFAVPTRYDTFSLATLEAMASGLPVIVSRAAGITEILSPNRDSIVLEDPNDIELLSEHIRRLMIDEHVRTSLGVEARRTAERHSWDEVARRTLGVYEESLSNDG